RRIGAAIARRLHRDGFDLALHCHGSHAELQALAGTLEAARPGSVLVLQADLQAEEAPAALVQACIARYGRLDGLGNTASNFFLAQAAAAHLRERGGAVVNLADVYAGTPLRGHPLYSAAKAALVSLTRGLAQALAPQARANAVAPGAILWPEQAQDPAAQATI